MSEDVPQGPADSLTHEEMGAKVRSLAASWRDTLGRGAAVERLSDDDHRTWTPLQRGCLVRDLCEQFEKDVRLILKKRKPPKLSSNDFETEANKEKYAAEEPAKVAYSLASNAGKFADLLDRIDGDEWTKQGRRDHAVVTADELARELVSTVEHALWDVRQQMEGN